MNNRRVVITGLGVVSPVGIGVEEFWGNILAGHSGVDHCPMLLDSDCPCKIAAEVKDFHPEQWIGRKETKRMDRFAQFGLVGAYLAMEDAALDLDKEDRNRIGVAMGTAFSGLHFHEQEYEVWRTRGHEAMSSYASIGIYTGSCSGQISIHLGLNAPSFTIATGCECSTAAIAQAAELIIANEADVMFAGGADAPIRPAIMSAFSITHALATRNDEPARASRPFDRKRNGFVMGEGGCVLVLEELERARRRGATIYAEITGSANTCDAHHMCHPHPTGEQAARCMEMAMTRAGINPSDVDYLSAHGSSTPLGDSTETLVLKTVLGQQAYNIPLSSIKSTVGHTQGACGALEVAASCMALRHNIIPPTINRDYPDPECDLDCVPHRPRHRLLNTIVKNSFGFGGRNTVLVLERVAPAESALFVPVTPIQTEAYCQ